MGDALDMAVIDWCKLFGSDDEERQPVHWKNQVPADKHDAFRTALFDAVGVSPDEWWGYWKKTKDYRDKQAAHFEAPYVGCNTTYPDLTRALEAAYFYYDWLRADGAGNRLPADLRDYCRRFAEQAERTAAAAYVATTEIGESVY